MRVPQSDAAHPVVAALDPCGCVAFFMMLPLTPAAGLDMAWLTSGRYVVRESTVGAVMAMPWRGACEHRGQLAMFTEAAG